MKCFSLSVMRPWILNQNNELTDAIKDPMIDSMYAGKTIWRKITLDV